jgi:hypothetical protein
MIKHTFFRTLVAGFGLMALTFTGFAQEPDVSLDALSTEAYLAMMDGDRLQEDGEPESALEKYLESQERYLDLRERDPDFKSRVVSYRLDLLQTKIADLRPEPAASPTPETPEVTQPQSTGPEDFQTLFLQAREQLAKETARLATLEKRMIEADARVRQSREELKERNEELRTVRRELVALKESSGERNEILEEELKDVTKFNELLKARSDEVEEENRKLLQARGELAGQVADQQERLETLQAELQAAKEELANRKMSTTQSEQRLILERNQLRDDKTELTRRLEEQQDLMTSLQERIEDVALLEESVIVLNNRNEALIAELQNLKEDDKRSANRKEMKDLRRERDRLETQNSELQQRLGSLSLQLKAQQDLIQAMQQSAANQSAAPEPTEQDEPAPAETED